MSTNNKISNLVNSQVPFFVRNDHEKFVQFLEAYYRYLEQDEKAIEVSKNISSYRDVDRTLSQYENLLYQEYVKFLPSDIKADKALVIKHIKDFYSSRGTEKSIKFLLNVLFGREDVTFYYPKKDILKASDGKWYVQRSLRIEDLTVDGTSNTSYNALVNFINRPIYGANSGATAIGERVDQFYADGTFISEVSISSIKGTFENGEQIYTYFEGVPIVSGANTITPVLQLTANLFSGILNSIIIDNPGAGYNVGDPVIIESNTGTGALAIVSHVSSGNVSSITVLEGGAGYVTNNYVFITGGGGSGANGELSLIRADGLTHPNTYLIYFDTISREANTNTTNGIANGIYESFAYQNLNVVYTRTSNLVANTYTSLSSLNLSGWLSNSNVYFETFDSLNLTNQISGISNTVLVTSTNTVSNTIYISPAYATPQKNLRIQIIKKANSNTTIANGVNSYAFANVGPAVAIRMNLPGSGYTSTPSISIQANTQISELGILGKMIINDGGSGYVVGDVIEFINVLGGYGTGGAANVRTVNATGAITNVQFMFVPGHPVGGSGYNQNYLPSANVISATGTGANIAVTQLLGTGGTFIVANSVLGTIERITITNRGSGYTDIPSINLTQSGDGTATANATIVEGVFSYPGRWLNDDGHISSANYLQNRDYYQQYSYVIRSGVSTAKYKKALKDLIHPAGMKMFGAYVEIDNQENYNFTVQANTETISREITASYGANGNVIINYPSHGLYVGNTVGLKFVSGNIANYANSYATYTPNTLYRVSNVVNSDYFFVNSGTWLPGKANVSNIEIDFEVGLEDLYLREDGRKLYTIGTTHDRINEYDLLRTHDVTTAVYKRRHTTAFTETGPRSFDISPDGKYVYVIGTTQDRISQYEMTEAWNIQSLTTTANTYNVNTNLSLTNVFGIRIKPDGNTVYISDTTTDIIYQLSLSEAWNINTASYQTEKYFSGFEASLQSMYFKSDGNVMYFTGATRGRISSVPLTVSWNINTANMLAVSNSFNIISSTVDATPTGIYLANNGNTVYITGNQHDVVYQIRLLDSWNVNSAFYMTNTSGNVRVTKVI